MTPRQIAETLGLNVRLVPGETWLVHHTIQFKTWHDCYAFIDLCKEQSDIQVLCMQWSHFIFTASWWQE